MIKAFTVCCLFYGDRPDLVERLMKSLARPEFAGNFELRVGINNLSAASEKVLKYYLDTAHLTEALTYRVQGDTPYYKYPVMRRLFYTLPISTPYMMWFDDDSYIKPSAPIHWFNDVEDRLRGKYQLVGAPYFKHPEGNQLAYWAAQKWHTGRKWRQHNGKPVVHFITGGWWAAHVAMLRAYDYPIHVLEHNGGDVLLGAMMHQGARPVGKFTQHLGINCDDSGRCSSAPRRGYSGKPLGYDYASEAYVETPPEPVELESTATDWHTILG